MRKEIKFLPPKYPTFTYFFQGYHGGVTEGSCRGAWI